LRPTYLSFFLILCLTSSNRWRTCLKMFGRFNFLIVNNNGVTCFLGRVLYQRCISYQSGAKVSAWCYCSFMQLPFRLMVLLFLCTLTWKSIAARVQVGSWLMAHGCLLKLLMLLCSCCCPELCCYSRNTHARYEDHWD